MERMTSENRTFVSSCGVLSAEDEAEADGEGSDEEVAAAESDGDADAEGEDVLLPLFPPQLAKKTISANAIDRSAA